MRVENTFANNLPIGGGWMTLQSGVVSSLYTTAGTNEPDIT